MAAVLAAALSPELKAEIARGMTAVGAFSSEAPAMRGEPRPSPGFALGAALAAWSNAKTQLDFDLANPQSAGPAHAHLDQMGDDLLRQECREEAAAFADLETRSAALGLAPADIAPVSAEALTARRASGPAAACR
jgi:hypothetical protein